MIVSAGDMIYWDSPILGLIGPGKAVEVLDAFMLRVEHPFFGVTMMIPRSWIVEVDEKKSVALKRSFIVRR